MQPDNGLSQKCRIAVLSQCLVGATTEVASAEAATSKMRSHFMVLHVLVTASIVAVNFASEIKGKTDDAEELIEEPVEKAGQKLHEFLHLLQYIKKCNKPRQCSDLLRYGQHKSGVFRIYHLKAFRTGQDVYCDMEADGGGWTVIQRRGQFGNRVFNFYRDWNEYAQGFGSPNQEYWIGNEALNALTSGNKNTALRIVLRNSTEDSINIYYNSIRVASADKKCTRYKWELFLARQAGTE
ncbi:hypothetical protein MTO96_017874 [Rhipicephalus appendiculatus]